MSVVDAEEELDDALKTSRGYAKIILHAGTFYLVNNKNEVVFTGKKSDLVDYLKARDVAHEYFDIPRKDIENSILRNTTAVNERTFYPAYITPNLIIPKGNSGDDKACLVWNTFRPNIYTRLWYKTQEDSVACVDGAPHEFSRLWEFFDMFFEHEDERKWFLHRIAAAMRHPDRRLPTSLIFWGVQGSGKDTVRIILERLLGEDYVSNIDGKIIQSNFNAYVAEKLVVFANEVFNWEKKQEHENFLKNYVSNDHLMVNRKFTQEYIVNNYALWIFATNDPNFTPFDESDRRYSYFTQTRSLISKYADKYKIKDDDAYKTKVMPFIDFIKDKDHDAGACDEFHALYTYLMKLNIDWNLISHPLHTDARLEAIEQKFEGNMLYYLLEKTLIGLAPILKEKEGKMFIPLKAFYDRYAEECPRDKVMGKIKFRRRMASSGIISNPAMRTIDGENDNYVEIISPLLISKLRKRAKPDYEKGTLKEKGPVIEDMERANKEADAL